MTRIQDPRNIEIQGTTDTGDPILLKSSDDGELHVYLAGDDQNKYIVLVDDNADGNTYVGYAVPGSATGSAVWQIIRISESGTVTSVLLADGNNNFDNIWTGRTGLSYS